MMIDNSKVSKQITVLNIKRRILADRIKALVYTAQTRIPKAEAWVNVESQNRLPSRRGARARQNLGSNGVRDCVHLGAQEPEN